MSETFFPRLCGGTFFTLLTRAMKLHGRSRDTSRGISGITEAGLFKALIRVFYPSMPTLAESTEKSNASNYKKCENPSQSSIPLTDPALLNSYVELVADKYSVVLKRMDAVVNEYIDVEGHGEWLVQALLQLIREDQSIPGNAKFLICPDGSAMTKEDMKSATTFYLQSFLVGVWTAILRNIPNNEVGKQTYAAWYQTPKCSRKGTRPEFISSIGNSTGRYISVSLLDIEKDYSAEEAIVQHGHKLSQEYASYLTAARKKFSTIKTIMDKAPKPFYDFYVCNGLMVRRITSRVLANLSHEDRRIILRNLAISIPSPTIDAIEEVSHFIIIEGTGGLGKSMMMRHLMLNSIDRVDFIGKLPIFVTLKDYNQANIELADFIFGQFSVLCPSATREQFYTGLAKGAFTLLLDGLDEINSRFQGQFDRTLNTFADAYSQNVIVVSSRPISKFTRFQRFFEMELVPFSKEQALQLIDKLEFRPDAPEFKKKFRESLDKQLYNSYHEFAENPLLLTFMLMRTERYGNDPTKMYRFYEEVYDVLSDRHDTSKDGYSRVYKSGLTPDRIKYIFAAFCANTYVNQKYNLTQHEMEEYVKDILDNSRFDVERDISPADLVQDFTSGVCMMYEEGQEYHFMHRSFQEYFCALSFSKQMDEDLERIGEFFEQISNNQRSDQVLKMLHDMIPDRVEKFIFIPFLTALMPGKDNKTEYWNFVKKNYATFCYDVGETDGGSGYLYDSFLLEFILTELELNEDLSRDELPLYEDLVENQYIRVTIGDRTEVIDKRIVPPDVLQQMDEDGEPEVVGWTLVVDTKKILKQQEKYKDLISAMEREDFLFVRQFEALKRFLAELITKHSKPKRKLISVV